MKIAHNLLGLAFAAGCFGLWMVMRLQEMLHRAHPFPEVNAGGGHLAHGWLETFCVVHASWLPYLGIPAIAYSLVVSIRGKASIESLGVFAAALAFLFTILFFTVLVGCMASWIPLYD
jgi:hypothetical protein